MSGHRGPIGGTGAGANPWAMSPASPAAASKSSSAAAASSSRASAYPIKKESWRPVAQSSWTPGGGVGAKNPPSGPSAGRRRSPPPAGAPTAPSGRDAEAPRRNFKIGAANRYDRLEAPVAPREPPKGPGSREEYRRPWGKEREDDRRGPLSSYRPPLPPPPRRPWGDRGREEEDKRGRRESPDYSRGRRESPDRERERERGKDKDRENYRTRDRDRDRDRGGVRDKDMDRSRSRSRNRWVCSSSDLITLNPLQIVIHSSPFTSPKTYRRSYTKSLIQTTT